MSGFVTSEIDLGVGGEADQSSQVGGAIPSDTVRTDSGSGQQTQPIQPQGDGQVGGQQPPAESTLLALEGSTATEATSEDGVNWATAPEQFRNSYEKNKVLRERAEQERETFKQELEDFRAKQGQGVFLNTDIPFEDFKPFDELNRMATEEPEYHDAVVDAVLQAHMWPNIASTLSSLEGKQLGRIDESTGALVFDGEDADEQRMQYQQIQQAWDFLARRTAGISGQTLSGLIKIVTDSPEIQQAIEAKLNGGYAPAIQAGTGFQQQPQFGQQSGFQAQQPIGVQTLQQIAQAQTLDLSDPEHVRQAGAIQASQRQAASIAAQAQFDKRTLESQISQLRSQLEKVQGGQQQAQTTTAQEAEQRAESRVSEHLRTALDTEFTERYAAAIPRDRPGLANILKTQAREQLNENPTFKEAKATAMKWFKQAATATSPESRQKYDEKGLGAMAVIATLRTNTMAEVAKELLGKLPAQAAAARAKIANKGRQELPGGTTARPEAPRPAASASGDIEANRAAIRQRMKNAGITI